MWELRTLKLHRPEAVQRLLLFVIALAVTVFGYIFLSAPTALAVDATWNDDIVVYEGNNFSRNNNNGLADLIGVNEDAVIFQYPRQPTDRVEYIYFSDGATANLSDSAEYVAFDFSPPNSLTNGSSPIEITVEPRADSIAEANRLERVSSCEVNGIGWLICPITDFLAKGTDWLFAVLTNLLEVRPILTDTDAPLFRIWEMMLGIANLAFIVAFMIVIYSHLTSFGLSNYGIKRMLPRIIIAAILVNVSYYICAIAVDISNLLGHSLQSMFIDMRNQVVGEGGNSWQIVSWEDMATVILSGGAAATVGLISGVVAVSTYGIGGAIILLLPALLGVLLAVLVAILVLAVRQALITVLIILAPLAFVAYLLPNTEKWFDKWRSTFMTMLLLFPIFSVLFGGAQLAGAAIVQNAKSLDVMILGMVTQIAPIVITPFLIKFSGSLIGRIAGMVNNPNKGLLDKARSFTEDQAEHIKQKRLAGVMKNPPKRHQILRQANRSREIRRRNREAERALWSQEGDREYERLKGTDRKIQGVDVDLKLASLETDNFKQESQRRIDELRAGNMRSITIQPEKLATESLRRAQEADKEGRLLASQVREAQSEQKSNFARKLEASEELRNIAGGINQTTGPQSAWASAIAEIDQAEETAIAEARTLADYYNFKSDDYKKMAMTGHVEVTDDDGNVRKFTRDNEYMRKAAIREMFTVGVVPEIDAMIAMSGKKGVVERDSGGNITKEGLFEYRETISNALAKSSHGQKTVYGSGKIIDDVKRGKITSEEDLDASILSYVEGGKFSAEKLATMDARAITRLLEAIKKDNRSFISPDNKSGVPAAVEELKATAYEALTNSTTKTHITKASKPLLEKLIKDYTPPANP